EPDYRFPAPHRPLGSPATPATRQPACRSPRKWSTSSPASHPHAPTPPGSPDTSADTGRSKTRSTTYAMWPCAKTPVEQSPATSHEHLPPYATSPSAPYGRPDGETSHPACANTPATPTSSPPYSILRKQTSNTRHHLAKALPPGLGEIGVQCGLVV